MARTFVDGKIHVRETLCETCIFRPGNLMQLHEGRVEQMEAKAIAEQGVIPCHSHIHEDAPIEPVCRGFYNKWLREHAILQIAGRMEAIQFGDPEPTSS